MKLGYRTPHLWRSLLCIAAIGLSSTACVEDVGLVDRTSTDKMDKKLFEGVWLMQETTTGVPYSSAVSFVGEQPFLGGTRKVIFDIQEDWIVAYPVTETIEGSEAEWKTNSIRKYWDPDARDQFVELYVGPPAARWPIASHFDVKRAYNSFNGAQSNEVTENTADRPWYERDYIRVNWAQQGIQDFFYSLKGADDSFYVGEERPGHPDEMRMDVEGGYFDFVVHTLAWSAGQNRCSIYGLSPYACAKTEVTVRNSFRRMDSRRDYEPLRYHNDEHQDKFGFFATERSKYDVDWGSTYRGSIAWADRWNLWMNTYDFVKPVDEAGAAMDVDCFVDKDCDRDAGQRCQKDTGWFDNGYCATPVAKKFADRGLRPIIYHLNADWHLDYLKPAYEAADDWNDVFTDAVAWLLFYEEKGLARPRDCNVHADCAADRDVLVDAQVTVVDDGTRCFSNDQCGASSCAADGFCGRERACGNGNPCAVGQTCSGGFCEAGGARVVQRTQSSPLRGSTVYAGTPVDGNPVSVVSNDTFPGSLRSSLPNGSSYVRLIHLAPNAGDLGLDVNGTIIAGGAFAADRDYDPINPATAPFMATVAGAGAATFRVTQNGGTVAETIADIVPNAQYVAIYNGEDVIVVGATFNDSSRGIRMVHANAQQPGGGLDFGVAGVRMDEGVRYQFATDYASTAGSQQRATVSLGGSAGDLTCYESDTIKRCVGWAAEFTDADQDRVREIKLGIPPMFALCSNSFDPIAAQEQNDFTVLNDSRYTADNGYNLCGDPALVPAATEPKLLGDVRYSLFNWVNEPQRSGPLGYGPSQADPQTGQLLHANANIYGGSIHTYSQYAMDIIDLVNGDLDPDSLVTGKYIRDYIDGQVRPDDIENEAVVGALSAGDPTGPSDSHKHFGHGHHNNLADHAVDLSKLSVGAQRAHKRGIKAPIKAFRDYEQPELLAMMKSPGAFDKALRDSAPKVDPAMAHNRLGKVKGTWIEDLLINNEIRLAADHVDPDGTMSYDEMQNALSPTSWSTKYAMRQEAERTALFAKNNLYMGEFVDDAIYGLALEMKSKLDELVTGGMTAKDAREVVRIEVGNRILRGVLGHEVGHTVGLRHNFSGSTDVFNFHDEYYTIREKETILCQSDSWCDDIGGAACAIKSCGDDTDCGAGTLCGGGGVCSAPDASDPNQLVATGECATVLDQNATCTSDDQCGADGNTCFENRCFAPRQQYVPRPFMTDLERASKRTEYQYTTTMDYGGRFNSDFQGLGKYDYAAIKFGYTQLVDTYRDTSKVDQRVINTANLVGSTPAQYSFYRNSGNWSNRGTGIYHPFQYLTNYIGVEENLNRLPVPYEQVKYQEEMAVNDVREYLDVAFVEVPYAYCSDEYRGNMGCYYFDQGIDMFEMAAGATEQLEQYYIFDAFKRERLYYGMYGSPFSYYGRIMDRYLRVIGDVGMYYALYDNLLFRYSWYQDWKESPLGGRTLEQSALRAYANLKDQLASPAPGSYAFDPAMGAYTNISLEPDAEGSEFNVPFGVGRYPYTQFGSDLGYNYYEHPVWFGSFWEKLASLVTLTDSTAYFSDTAVGEQLNIGVGTSLGFNTVFGADLNNFLGGMIAGDLDFYAGRAVQNRYTPPSIAGPMVANTPVEPTLNNFTMKLYAALYGLAFMPAGFDPQFIDRLAVFFEGEATQYLDGDSANVTEFRFEDPIGGKIYLAYSTNYGNFEDEKIDVAANLVVQAQDMADDWALETDPVAKARLQRDMSEIRDVLDVLRGLNQTYGTSTLGL
ncbi:MAG: hypothetical protein ACI9MR_000652 [Myxococcota bacterium]|jgi:hypothetical protein